MTPANILTATDIILGFLARAQTYGNVVRAARAAGRDVSDEELDQLARDDDASRAAGQEARAKAIAEGR